MSLRLVFNRKRELNHFVTFVCEACVERQIHAVPIARKTIKCFGCGATHRVHSSEVSDTLKPQRSTIQK